MNEHFERIVSEPKKNDAAMKWKIINKRRFNDK